MLHLGDLSVTLCLLTEVLLAHFPYAKSFHNNAVWIGFNPTSRVGGFLSKGVLHLGDLSVTLSFFTKRESVTLR